MKGYKLYFIIFFTLCVLAKPGQIALAETSLLSREDQIEKLLDKRQIELQNNSNSEYLNEINKDLYNLGVEFISYSQAVEMFPEIEDEFEISNTLDLNNSANKIMSRIAAPSKTKKNTYATYRIPNYSYNGKLYNIQKLTVQPTDISSNLWRTGSRGVNFNYSWVAGTTELLKTAAITVAESALGVVTDGLIDIPLTVYDLLSSGWSGLTRVTEIDPSDVTYTWDCQTTVVFDYVKLEGEDDDKQFLAHISTKCITDVACVIKMPKCRQNGNGEWVLYPHIETGVKTIRHTPFYYGSITKAVQAYERWCTYSDCVEEIQISGPENKRVQNIYPCIPLFPLHCE